LAIENFAAASRRGRLASGKLVVDVVATKRRFTFSFEKIMAADFEVWDAQYRSTAFRELEVENRDGTYTKATVEFGLRRSDLGSAFREYLKTLEL